MKDNNEPTEEHPNNTSENVKKYLHSSFENTYYLGYRDVPFLLQKYVKGKKAIDYGCGTGRSTRFLKSLGFDAIGVDISREMLKHATNIDDSPHFLHINSGKIPILDSSTDLVFSCFVLFTISSKSELLTVFKEINRCLKKDGIFIAVTGSEELYSREWLSYNVNFSENRKLTSGSTAKIHLKDIGINFINYYWTDKDYHDTFSMANFRLLEKRLPLGTYEERQDWLSETKYPPYTVYVLQKAEN